MAARNQAYPQPHRYQERPNAVRVLKGAQRKVDHWPAERLPELPDQRDIEEGDPNISDEQLAAELQQREIEAANAAAAAQQPNHPPARLQMVHVQEWRKPRYVRKRRKERDDNAACCCLLFFLIILPLFFWVPPTSKTRARYIYVQPKTETVPTPQISVNLISVEQAGPELNLINGREAEKQLSDSFNNGVKATVAGGLAAIGGGAAYLAQSDNYNVTWNAWTIGGASVLTLGTLWCLCYAFRKWSGRSTVNA